MKIESRIPEAVRELQTGNPLESSAGRQGSVTSDPIGGSPGKTDETAPEFIGKGIRSQVKPPPDPIDVGTAVEKLNEIVQSQKTNVSFTVDADAETTVIKIFKTETGELIRQIPPEEILAIRERVQDSVGWLYDAKA